MKGEDIDGHQPGGVSGSCVDGCGKRDLAALALDLERLIPMLERRDVEVEVLRDNIVAIHGQPVPGPASFAALSMGVVTLRRRAPKSG